MTDPLTESDAWQRGATAARQQTSDITVKHETPVSYTTAATSILASPHIKDWPAECQEWLLDKCPTALDPPPVSTSDLDPTRYWTDWGAAMAAALTDNKADT